MKTSWKAITATISMIMAGLFVIEIPISALTEWGWHNAFYGNDFLVTHTRSVNFDMGTNANSNSALDQMWGYFNDYIKR